MNNINTCLACSAPTCPTRNRPAPAQSQHSVHPTEQHVQAERIKAVPNHRMLVILSVRSGDQPVPVSALHMLDQDQ